MKFKRSLSLFLALIMALGTVMIVAGGMMAFAIEKTDILDTISIDLTDDKFDKSALTLEVDQSADFKVIALHHNSAATPGYTRLTNGVTWEYSVAGKVQVQHDTGDKYTLVALGATDGPVTVTANYSHNGVAKQDTMTVTVVPKIVRVTSMSWLWDGESSKTFIPGQTVSFKDKYSVLPSTANNKDVVLTCDHPELMEIDNAKKTFTINPISASEVKATITLTSVDSKDAAKPIAITKDITVLKEIPLSKVSWTFVTDGQPGFTYYNKSNGLNIPAEYYYKKENGNDVSYKYETVPSYARDLCTIKVTSADKRVIRVDEDSCRLIPVGNGDATVTITATTPDGKRVQKGIMVVHVVGSPYTPITELGFDMAKLPSSVSYDKGSNTISGGYKKNFTLVPATNAGGNIDHDALTCEFHDGRKDMVTAPKANVSWTSSNPSVAKVDEKGNVTCLKRGEAVITLTVNDNGPEDLVASVKVKSNLNWWQTIINWILELIASITGSKTNAI